MKPIDFKEQNKILAKGQEEYGNLPINYALDGTATSCWELSPEDLKNVLETGKIFVSVSTFRQPMQPINVYSQNPSYMVNPLKQKTDKDYYSTGIGCMIRASNVDDMIDCELALIGDDKVIKLNKWLSEKGFSRKRFENENEVIGLGIPYLKLGIMKNGYLNSIVMHDGKEVHNTNVNNIPIIDTIGFEIFPPINETDEKAN